MDVTFLPLNADEYEMLCQGVSVGYCGRRPGMAVNFLSDAGLPSDKRLSPQQKLLVVDAVERKVGEVKETRFLQKLRANYGQQPAAPADD